VKTIETERLVLRPFELEDAGAFFRLGSDPEIIRYVGNVPLESVEEAGKMLAANSLRDYEVYGYGRFACILKETGDLVGFSGLKFVPELEGVDLGYRFWPELWGKGLATEAGRASIDFARELGIDRLIGLVVPENRASAHVLEKLGFSYVGKRDVHFWHVGEEVDEYGLRLGD
jgi:RimJ/RimL family protein N-acetyltransferase